MAGGQQYLPILRKVFEDRHKKGATRVPFEKDDLINAARALGVERPKNIPDNIYSFRFRRPLPEDIMRHAPKGREWVIRLAGRGKYAFELVKQGWFFPNSALSVTKIPDATPAIITRYALNDEQALLAILRYNRLIDIFMGVTCYSLQSHLRTTVEGIAGDTSGDRSQIETDEVYLGVDERGAHYLLPVQAKGGSDIMSVVQIEQDFAVAEKAEFANLIPSPIGAQFVDDGEPNARIALFEFEQNKKGEVSLAREKHYRLVPSEDLTDQELERYRRRNFG